MNRHALESFVETVNCHVCDSIDSQEYDKVFLDSLDECEIDETELGEAFETEMGDWYWNTQSRVCVASFQKEWDDGEWYLVVQPRNIKMSLIQYRASGRVALIERG